jgi:hypothetical protein
MTLRESLDDPTAQHWSFADSHVTADSSPCGAGVSTTVQSERAP